jgi:DNA-directed RNA polymerase specialized sigma24 family protein
MGKELEEVDWKRALKRLTAFAFKRLRNSGQRASVQDAQDIACEAIRRVFDPKYKDWDPAAEPNVVQHLASVVNGLVSNRRRTKRELLLVDAPGATGVAEPVDESAAADDKVLASEILDRATARIESDRVATDVLLLELEGVSKPSDQAHRLKLSVSAVNNARRRLENHFAVVRSELQQEERDAVEK